MLLVTKFDIDADLIDVPQSVIEQANVYQEQFFSWLFNKNNNHKYWWYEKGKKVGCAYRSDAFIEWLNAFPLRGSKNKAKSVSVHVFEYDNSLPSLFF